MKASYGINFWQFVATQNKKLQLSIFSSFEKRNASAFAKPIFTTNFSLESLLATQPCGQFFNSTTFQAFTNTMLTNYVGLPQFRSFF